MIIGWVDNNILENNFKWFRWMPKIITPPVFSLFFSRLICLSLSKLEAREPSTVGFERDSKNFLSIWQEALGNGTADTRLKTGHTWQNSERGTEARYRWPEAAIRTHCEKFYYFFEKITNKTQNFTCFSFTIHYISIIKKILTKWVGLMAKI